MVKKNVNTSFGGLPPALAKILEKNGVSMLTSYDPVDRRIMRSMRLNKILGGGLPVGRIVTLSGNSDTGKTTTALHIAESIANDPKNWRNQGYVAFWDTENKYDPTWAAKIGLSGEKFMAVRAEAGEGMCRAIEAQIESDLFEIIIIDSIDGTSWEAQLEADIGDNAFAVNARQWSKELMRLVPMCRKHNVTLLALNHVFDAIGGAAHEQREPGGKKWLNQSTIRLRTTTPKVDIAKGELKVHITCKKNHTAATVNSDVWIEYNFFDDAVIVDDVPELVEIGKDLGVITGAGAWITYGDQKYNGGEALATAMRESEELYTDIREQVIHALEVKNKKPSVAVALAGLEDYTGQDEPDVPQGNDDDAEEAGINSIREEQDHPGSVKVLSGEHADLEGLPGI